MGNLWKTGEVRNHRQVTIAAVQLHFLDDVVITTMVEISGEPDANGMVLDYYDMKTIIQPVIDELDHSFMVYAQDKEVLEFLNHIDSKKVVVDFQSTAENICLYLLGKIKETSLPKNIKSVKVKVLETENTYAEEEIVL